jgi:uncharacterized membrane protein
MDVRERIDVAAPPADVWAVMIDVERWREWTPTITSIERLDGGPFRVGSRARVRQPKLPIAVWTVTALEPGRYFEWRNVSPGVTSVAGHRAEPSAGGGTTVTLTFGWSGWLAWLIRLIYGKLARRYVRTEAESLKRWCERAR